jgi:Domain of unknown function (DUF222)/HNH endonuclease
MELDALSECIDHLLALGPSAFADGSSIETLQRQLARMESFVTTAVAEFDRWGEWATEGARTPAAWLTTRCQLSGAEARRQVRRGRRLAHLPVCAGAWARGDLTSAQVDVMIGLSREVTEEALSRDEEILVGEACTLRHDQFVRVAAYWEQLADPDGTEAEALAQADRRDVYLAQSLDKMWLGGMTLDPMSGATVAGELNRLEHALFEADWAEAKAALGREPRAEELARTSAQRRSDALVEMATRSKTAPADGRRPAPLFTVLVGYETLHGRVLELAGGGVLSPGSLLPWLDQAYLERAVFQPGGRVEVGTTTRLFTGATRRAIELRDRECTHPYCDQRLEDCEVDHIVPYAAGGPTTQENGRLLCGFHNRLRSQPPGPDG